MQYRAMAAIGALGRSGEPPRWLFRALDALELGLRSLLIIGARGVKPTPYSRFVIPDAKRLGIQLPFSPEARFVDGSPDGCAVGDDMDGGFAPEREQRAFSLSLKGFDFTHQSSSRFGGAAVEAETHSSTLGETGEVDPRNCDGQAPLGGDDIYERPQIEPRLAAIFDVFTNPDAYIVRMARRLAHRGVRLKRHPMRPTGAVRALERIVMPQAPARTVATADTS